MISNIEKAKEINALTLAFLGDAVYSLKIKEFLVKNNNIKVGELNTLSTKAVRASAQAQVFDAIFDSLNENEHNVAARAKNIHTTNVPKNSNLEEYKKATSLEAVVGFNFLCENDERINQIIESAKEVL